VSRIRQLREPRLITRCRVEFERLDQRIVAESEDLSRRGVFVRTEELLPVGAVTELVVTLPADVQLRVVGRVVHLLSPSAARALGRHVGMGFEFQDGDGEVEGHDALVDYLDDLIEDAAPAQVDLPAVIRVVVAEPSMPLRERITAALEQAGFAVDGHGDGAEAYASCVRQPPDVVVVAAHIAGMDGWMMLKTMAAHPRLFDVPVVFTSDDPSDMTRLQAYRLGVRDYISKPFIEEELVIRLTRLVTSVPRTSSGSAMLRGSLAEISLATLLSLLEFERKSGILLVLHEGEAGRLFVAQGRVVKVEAGEAGTSRERLMRVLDWATGVFEFTSCEVIGADEIGLSTAALLLEHARIRDEEQRDRAARREA
jgi:DNA-binding response OmpR family regulator/Tfp pilus assembly protein PilZ